MTFSRWLGSQEGPPRSPLLASLALVGTLLAMGALVVTADHRVATALVKQDAALGLDAAFTRAQISVANEAIAVRDYRVEPSPVNAQRLTRTLRTATEDLATALVLAEQYGAQDSEVLSHQQQHFADRARDFLLLAEADSPSASRIADVELVPTHRVLSVRLEAFAAGYQVDAQQRLTELRRVHDLSRTVQSIGGLVTGFIVAVVLRMLLRFSRRVHAEARSHERASLHDPLTGLLNRAGFRRSLEEPRAGGAGVALIDLDAFKAVNDTHGHAAGDAVLVAVSDLLRRRVRSCDAVARLGGDEFAVLLPGMACREDAGRWAESLAADLRFELHLDSDTVPGGASVQVGGSVGVAVATGPEDPDGLLNRADRAMYRAKGRFDKTGCPGWALDVGHAPGAAAAPCPAAVPPAAVPLTPSH
ncbi:diguanylate cyclase (GGDEF)-like protein [Kineococcus xinjiangensis]|uniref:Diguanylate cyclase (GGDEF)-like protein n=1 Tax=Kineococcus xinjiangensis TaxID=512762 RepID=A0A2S6IM73_9ACTN|nr:GGDEF domain-containing protein [Kineococcus xinjiangensis]PPK95319.1 diguanylate cyclase (GGDEF)-like protein [Kineococcus xinjiangensis]